MIKKLFGISFVGFCILLMGCNDINDFASFLVVGDEVKVEQTDFELQARTLLSDSVRTYNDSIFTPGYFMGAMNDPIFGMSRASIFFQARITAEADFSRATLDSVVLSVAYDTVAKGYGAIDMPQNFEVYRLQSDLSRTASYYSNTIHTVDPEPIGSIEGVIPNFTDTLRVVEPVGLRLDTNLYDPHLRIPLDPAFGEELLSFVEADFVNNEAFLQRLKGIEVRATSNDGGMIYLDMTGGLTRINLYYSEGDTARQFIFSSNTQSVVTNTFTLDKQGSDVEAVLGDLSAGDSLLYIQSMGGTEVEFIIPDLSEIEMNTINSAYLDLSLAMLPEDDTTRYPAFTDIVAQQREASGDLVLITDIARFFRTNNYSTVYGLQVENGTGRKHFRINMTEYIIRLVKGEVSNRVVLSNLTNASEPTRALFYGPGHSTNRAILRVTHSEFSSN